MVSRSVLPFGWACLLGLAAALPSFAQTGPARTPPGGKFAILVAVSYDGGELQPLDHARDDMIALQATLRDSGFADENILVLADGADRRYVPDSIKLHQELARQLDNLEPDDLVVLAIEGHAVQFQKDKRVFFCPKDARLANPATTLISFEEIYRLLANCRAGRKLLLADVCYAGPRAQNARGDAPPLEPVASPQSETVPPGVVAIFGCAPGQVSHVRKEEGGSVFFHHVAKKWQSAVAGAQALTARQLFEDVRAETVIYSQARFGAGDRQAPVLLGNEPSKLILSEPLVRLRASEVRRHPPEKRAGDYGLLFRVRRRAEKTWAEATLRVAAEVYREPSLGKLLYLSQKGGFAFGPGQAAGKRASKGKLTYLHGQKLAARRAEEGDVTPNTRKWTVEVYRDEAAGNRVYVADSGALAVISASGAEPEEQTASALTRHVVELPVRKAGEWEPSRRFGVEIYQDGRTGDLIFLGENGALAVSRGPRRMGEPRTPEWRFRYELPLRKPGEHMKNEPRWVNVEAYYETYSGQLLFVTEDGFLALGGPGKATPDRSGVSRKLPAWLRSIDLGLPRPASQETAADGTSFAVELFHDVRSGLVLGLGQTGALTVTTKETE